MGSFMSLDLFVFFVFFEIVLVPMYFLIGGWGYERPGPGGHQVLPVHDDRFGVHARVDHRDGVHRQPQRRRPRHVRPGRDRRARRLRGLHRTLAVLRVRRGVRREGADLPAAHLAARRPHAGADGRFGRAGRCDAEARHLRSAAVRAVPVPRGIAVEPSPVAHAGGDRHHLRRDRRHHAEGPQAAGRLFVGRPPRLHRARHVRRHVAGGHRRRDADGQPRCVDRCAVPARRLDLRAPPHPPDRRSEGHPVGRPDLRRRLHDRDAVVDRRARPERVRRRVPDPDRLVPDGPLVRGDRCHRGDPRCAVPAVGLPAGVPRRARRGQQVVRRTEAERSARAGAVHRRDRVHGHLSQADARADRAGGRRPDRPCRTHDRLRLPAALRSW